MGNEQFPYTFSTRLLFAVVLVTLCTAVSSCIIFPHRPQERLSDHHRRAQRSAPINQTCGVFAVSEMISRMVEGYTMEEVVAGVHHAFARRISHLVGKEAGEIVAIGGVSGNGGVISALSEVLGKDVKVPEEPQIVNAVGAARYGVGSTVYE